MQFYSSQQNNLGTHTFLWNHQEEYHLGLRQTAFHWREASPSEPAWNRWGWSQSTSSRLPCSPSYWSYQHSWCWQGALLKPPHRCPLSQVTRERRGEHQERHWGPAPSFIQYWGLDILKIQKKTMTCLGTFEISILEYDFQDSRFTQPTQFFL